MSNNGTDRDVALAIVDTINNIKTSLEQINNNLYHVVILAQPQNVEDAITNETYTFSVSAANVVSYKWQSKNQNPQYTEWTDSGLPGNATDTLTVQATSIRFSYLYRCSMVGKDGETVYSNAVQLIAPAQG